jgi:hypothetical protein
LVYNIVIAAEPEAANKSAGKALNKEKPTALFPNTFRKSLLFCE